MSIHQNYLLHYDLLSEQFNLPKYYRRFITDTVHSDGVELHLDIYEYDKNAPTVILVPGTAIYALCYVELMYKIGESGFNVIGMDPRGHGRSGGIRGNYTINELTNDVSNVVSYVLENFNEQVSVLGSSQGGIVAFYAAAKDARIKSVICQSIAILGHPDTLQLTRYQALTKIMSSISGFASAILPHTKIPLSSYIDLKKHKLKYFGDLDNFLKKDPFALNHITLRAMSSLFHTKLAKPLKELETPTFIIQPQQDAIFPVQYIERIFGELNCPKRIKTYKNTSHGILVNDVDLVLPDILNWLYKVHSTDTCSIEELLAEFN
jgi:alpha-beta hydrolase superfamily lysophospholipase